MGLRAAPEGLELCDGGWPLGSWGWSCRCARLCGRQTPQPHLSQAPAAELRIRLNNPGSQMVMQLDAAD